LLKILVPQTTLPTNIKHTILGGLCNKSQILYRIQINVKKIFLLISDFFFQTFRKNLILQWNFFRGIFGDGEFGGLLIYHVYFGLN
jgi:hypothetical protein